MDTAKAAQVFKALANEQRLKLFGMVLSNCCGASGGYEKAFTKACRCMGLTKSTVSHHLKELRRAGLVQAERSGQAFTYTVNRKLLAEIREWIG